MDTLDCVVIGAGVVGLAVARALAQDGREVVILEAEDTFGSHTSSRNSEVIHAGLMYTPGSLKARLCRAGASRLYSYAQERGIGHRRIGKLIVATEEAEIAGLRKYQKLALANDVNDLQLLDARQLQAMEPQVRACAGLFSPSTGIIDSHGLMLSYLADAQAAGAQLVLRSPVLRGQRADGGVLLEIGDPDHTKIQARTVVNCAGLWADQVARSIEGVDTSQIPRIHYAIGHYYSLSGRSPFERLVYPVARQAALRVHATLDLAGQCKFGPDIAWRDSIDYRFDELNAASFYAGVRRFWPDLPDGALQPGYTGIRPRIAGPDALDATAADFQIQQANTHGVPGLINLFGIESPGLTASLALGEWVAALARNANTSTKSPHDH